MTNFKKKELLTEEESIGQLLQEQRKNKGMSLKKVSRKLKIKQEYLKYLEQGEFNNIPSGFYTYKFLEKYINYLDINSTEIQESLDNIFSNSDSKSKKIEFAHKKLKKNKFIIFPKIIKNILIILGVIVCIFYLGFYLNKITTPPELHITSPAKDITTQQKEITIKGSTEEESEVSINNKKIITNKKGNFSKTINLKPGVNIITITSHQKYSKTNKITRQILRLNK